MEYNFTGKNILIAEDVKVSRFYLEKALKRTKANLFFVNDGKEALEIIEQNQQFNLVLMDIRLPRMDGIEATSAIKKLKPDLPIIIQTAYDMQTAYDEAFKCGCDDYVTKPIDIENLLVIMDRYLNP